MNEPLDLLTPEQWSRSRRTLQQFEDLAKKLDARQRARELLGIDESHPRYCERLNAIARYALELGSDEQIDLSQFVEYYDQWLQRERRRERDGPPRPGRDSITPASTGVAECTEVNETGSTVDPFSTEEDRDQAIASYQHAWSKTRQGVANACGVAYQDLNKWKLYRELAKHHSAKRSRIEKELLRRPPAAI